MAALDLLAALLSMQPRVRLRRAKAPWRRRYVLEAGTTAASGCCRWLGPALRWAPAGGAGEPLCSRSAVAQLLRAGERPGRAGP